MGLSSWELLLPALPGSIFPSSGLFLLTKGSGDPDGHRRPFSCKCILSLCPGDRTKGFVHARQMLGHSFLLWTQISLKEPGSAGNV